MHPNYEPYWSNYLKQFDLDKSHFQNITRNTDKYCVIVEPRIDKMLILVIKNFMYLLQNKHYGLIIFHGTDNKEFLEKNLEGWNNIIYIDINKNNLTIQEYNQLYCSSIFWKILLNIGCKYALTFEIDTVLLKDNIDDFLMYDYIGAPWCIKWLGCLEVGNSGLSLRNVNKMLEITSTCPLYNNMNNDIYLSYWCLQKKYNIPTIEIAKQFSVETIYYNDPCGMHKPHIDKFPNKQSYIDILSKRYI